MNRRQLLTRLLAGAAALALPAPVARRLLADGTAAAPAFMATYRAEVVVWTLYLDGLIYRDVQ